MTHTTLFSLAEAQAAFQEHCKEQKREGRRKVPDAWITLADKTLAVVVYGCDADGYPTTIGYEYDLAFACAGIHEITEPAEEGAGHGEKERSGRPERLRAPLRQLHMFDAG